MTTDFGYSVTDMLQSLGWTSLEHHREFSHYYRAIQYKILSVYQTITFLHWLPQIQEILHKNVDQYELT